MPSPALAAMLARDAERGLDPFAVAPRPPALGHSTAELVWRRYGHVFEEARLAAGPSMVASIEAARAECERSGVRPACAQAPPRVLRSARPGARKPA